jgi:hypothetical protein
MLPIVLQGFNGLRVTLGACAVLGVALAIWQYAIKEWSWRFGAVVSLAAIADGGFVAMFYASSKVEQTVRDALCLFVLGIIWWALPAISAYEQRYQRK